MDIEETNPLGIYRIPLLQVLSRPVYEPLDVDVVGFFDRPDIIERMKHANELITDPGQHCDYVDLFGELMAI